MILERIVLHNFGPYLGRHEIELAPSSPKKPVVLFGGLNGGGKTSLLTALQLVLYGRQSSVWRSSASSYDGYLRSRIHDRADPQEGAGIELQFRSSMQGVEQVLHLCRYWRTAGSGIRESLDVIRDGELDTVLAENWGEWVEEFIPARVAPLFFFDGEKVEELADPNKSAQMLQSAVQSLLGLDVVDQLHSDLEIIERRKRKEVGAESVSGEAAKKEQELARDAERQQERVASRVQELAAAESELERLHKVRGDLLRKLAQEGGALFEGRHQFEASRDEGLKAVGELEEQLRSVASGALPLAMVLPMVERIEKDARSRQVGSVASTVLEVLTQRDDFLLARLRDLQASKTVMAGVQAFLEEDRSARLPQEAAGEPLLDAAGLARTHALQVHVLPTELVQAKAILRKLDEQELQVQGIERRLAGLPDEEKVLPLLAERDRIDQQIGEATRKRDVLIETKRTEVAELERMQKQLASARQELAETMLDTDDTKRMLLHSGKARETLGRFRRKVLEHHVSRIERLALECFGTLMRKQHLVKDLRIDPSTFEVTLFVDAGVAMPPHSLSAGERQLLAIALLWGLGRAAGRPLPTVIDTPLGRLDHSHRRNLVDRYFPRASHQVILLSTDAEIDEKYYRDLEPHVTRSYLLDFDDRKRETTVREGYFWEVA
jgi:DNA sulfur modification protein DndD